MHRLLVLDLFIFCFSYYSFSLIVNNCFALSIIIEACGTYM